MKLPQLTLREKIYLILEEPTSSDAAFAYSLILDAACLIGIVTTLLSADPTYLKNTSVVTAYNVSIYFFFADVSWLMHIPSCSFSVDLYAVPNSLGSLTIRIM